jgi:glycosyltransferase involved in cell wall biosynthesis
LHSPFNFGLPWFSPCPRVLTLHDEIYGSQAKWQQKLQPQALQISFHNWVAYSKAEAIITVSNHAKGNLIKYLGIPDRQISVIYEAADPNFHQPIQPSDRSLVRTKYKLNFPYIFYVGGWEQRKNIPFLLKAFAEAKLDGNLQGVKLVLAGGSDVQKIELQDLAIALNISESLELLGWVEEEDLPILYAEALCFVYPSEYEGFGLQLCEATAVGCPLLAANSTCLPEILGDGGQLFNLESTLNLKELMQNINANQQLSHQLKILAQLRSQDFGWGKTAQNTLEVYKHLQISRSK